MKIAVLKVKEKSSWQSCQTISKNLMSAYTMLGEGEDIQVEFCSYFTRRMNTDLLEIFTRLKKQGVTRVVILDHHPYPVDLFEVFAKVFHELNYYPEIFVHVYGCLMLWFNLINHKDPFFAKCKIHFITASVAQKELLEQFLNKNIQVSILNFPIDTNIFNIRKDQKALKKELGFAETDILLIYTGRAHIQKNLALLIQSVADIIKKNPNIKFLFAGTYDDNPINFLEYRFAYGTSQMLIQNAVKEGGIEKNFIALGSLPHKELIKYLNIADIFCSLSMYSDEDYGYAPLEALSAGCAALLSAWGGYKEFESPYTSFVKVRREYINKTDSLFISPTEVQTKLHELLQKLPFNREDISNHISDNYSISAIAKQLHELHKSVKAERIVFNQTAFLDFKKKRMHPLHPYAFLETYKSYYR